MIEKYTDPQYTQLPYDVPIPKKESWEKGYADGRASIVEEFEKLKTEISMIPTQTCIRTPDGNINHIKNVIEYEKDLFEIIDNRIKELKGEQK